MPPANSLSGPDSTPDSTLTHPQVVPFLEGDYAPAEFKTDLDDQGQIQGEAEAAAVSLFDEVQKAVDSKQLKPMVRTQYMRTAFQVSRGLAME